MRKRKKTIGGKAINKDKDILPLNGHSSNGKRPHSGKSKGNTTVDIHKEPDKPAKRDPLFPGMGIPQYTLLEMPERVDLPPIPNTGRPSFLVQIVTENPDVYRQLITLIRLGVIGHVAAVKLGINQNTFYDWAKTGRQELALADPPDTFHTRFYNDVRRAVATKRAELEMEIAVSDPKKWLSHGPGKIFGNDWSDHPNRGNSASPAITHEDTTDYSLHTPDRLPTPTDPSSTDPSTTNSSSGDTLEGSYRVIDEKTSLDALKNLQEQGIIEVSRSYKSQVNKQERNHDG